MGCCGFWLFCVDTLFIVNGHIVHLRARSPVCSPTGALLHRCLPSNLSITTQGGIVKLHGAPLELCTLNRNQFWDSKTALARVPRTVPGFVGNRGRGVEGYWVLGKWVQ